MERKGVVLSSVVALLGAVSAATGIAAEVTKIKDSDVNYVSANQCYYSRSAAYGLGLTAGGALLMAKIIINFATGCFCCSRTLPGDADRLKAIVFYVASWITFVIAIFMLISAALFNNHHGVEETYNGKYYCYIVKPGFFAAGAALAALSVIFGIFYYVTLATGESTNDLCGDKPLTSPNPSGIAFAMGQPQFTPHSPPQPSAVVFEVEHTIIRGQFT